MGTSAPTELASNTTTPPTRTFVFSVHQLCSKSVAIPRITLLARHWFVCTRQCGKFVSHGLEWLMTSICPCPFPPQQAITHNNYIQHRHRRHLIVIVIVIFAPLLHSLPYTHTHAHTDHHYHHPTANVVRRQLSPDNYPSRVPAVVRVEGWFGSDDCWMDGWLLTQ